VARPASFRLPSELLDRLDAEASSAGISVTALVASVLIVADDEAAQRLRLMVDRRERLLSS
jgi:predicted DNA-binding protein